MFITKRKIFRIIWFAIFLSYWVLNLGMSTEAHRIFTILYDVPIAKI